jgi:hypothetical protein
MDYYIDINKEILIVGKPNFKYRVIDISDNRIWVKKLK